ncbi:MAG: alpha/beta hydrolase [Gammaproteobacteria bacterium]|nr:alpha/beta hydrolase [Gammaproteobacteria bacterium]
MSARIPPDGAPPRVCASLPLRSIIVLTAKGDAESARNAEDWPRRHGIEVRVSATDEPDTVREALEVGRVDAVAAAIEAVRDAPLAALAAGLAARDRWIDYTPGPAPGVGDGCIFGRGPFSLTWALQHLMSANAHPYERHHYGDHPDQVGDLRLPVPTPDPPHGPDPPPTPDPPPLLVLLHGGFWREPYRRDVMAPLAVDLAKRGIATWNVEYRRVGGSGGCPQTFLDVAAAIDFTRELARSRRISAASPAVLGHSAGGHLALWSAARRKLPPGAPGAGPSVTPSRVIAVGAVADLAAARRLHLGAGAVEALVPSAADQGWADPAALLPLGIPQLLVHGDRDESVPIALARDYVHAARSAGDRVEWLCLPGVTHMPPIDPASDAWREILAHVAPQIFRS